MASSGFNGTHDEAKMEGPSFVIGRAANIGIVHWVDGPAWPLNTTLYPTNFHGNDPKFLYYLLSNEDLTIYNSGSVQPMLNRNYVAGHRLLLPPLDEQRAVAEILRSLDTRISWAAEAIARAEELLTGLAELAATRTPSIMLSDIARLTKDTVASTTLDGGSWSHHSIPAFDKGASPVWEEGAEIKSGKFRVPASAVLYSKLNPETSRVWITDDQSVNAICSTEFLPLVPVNGVSRGALFGALTTNDFSRQILERVSGGTNSHQRVKPDDVLAAAVGDPSALGDRAQNLADSLVTRILAARREAAALRRSHDALLPELVTGRLRINDVDSFLVRAGLA